MKSLKPSMKERKRYLLVSGKDIQKNISKAIFEFCGVLGASKISVRWIKDGKNYGIISINREGLDLVRASFCVFKERIDIKKVSGTIRGLN